MKRKLILSFMGAVPIALFAFSTGPPINRTGAAIDGGVNCTACHNTFAPANSDARGSVTISGASYTPGKSQVISVSVKHPDQQRWGFQLIARMASDQTKQAGTFTVDNIVRVRCVTGDAPCNGGLEYAEHVNAPRTNVGDGFTFQVTWTPPATDVGNVIFYAAGNAANGDGTPTGDRIYTTVATLTPSRPCALTAKPVITSVQNGASFASSIGPGAMISVFGSNFTNATTGLTAGAADFINNNYPSTLSCVAVEVNGTRVPITYASAKQINAQAPANLAAGPALVRVLLNPDLPNQVAGDTSTVTAQLFSPACFTFGTGAIAATVINSATPIADATLVPSGVTAKPGDIVTLWTTGLGPTNPAVPEGAVARGISPVTSVVSLTIGGIAVAPADILYAGLSPNSISGLYQVNVRLPAALPDGKATVALQVAGIAAQGGLTMPVHK